MYSAFFNSPPPSPKAQTYRRGPLPSSHKAFQPSAYTTARHRQHRSSSSSAARMSLSSLLAFAHLPDPSAHQRRRVGRLAVFLASLFVIAFVVVSRAGGEPQWLASLNARQVDAGASGPAVGYPASRAIYGRGEGREWNTRMAQAPLQAVAPAARPAFATSLVPASSPPLLPSEELAALVHFLVSNHHGSLPFDSSYSPATTPLRSDWVLDFEPGPAGPKRTAALRAFEREVWASAKFVVLGRLKTDRLFFEQTDEMLRTEYMLAPGELVMIDIDGRDDADTLYPVLQRLLATPTLPSVILRGTPLGTFESLASLHAAGQLKALLDAADVRLATKPRKQAKAAKQANVHRRNRQ